MNHADHVQLLRDGIDAPGGVWADFGSGSGAFTLALADLLGTAGQIYSIDRDAGALQAQRRAMQARFPSATVQYQAADFTERLDLPPLDGIVMANALHFVRHKDPVLQLLRRYLKDEGRLILVEYGTDHGNRWVPYPLSYPGWERLAAQNSFTATRRLHTVPSSFLGHIYSAVSINGSAG
ncbi:MAG TPA: methyltransferase domain-containing protein [Aggregatilinea sp.]|uniref:class I SAM-dependent methyltransferase n=1 Tax=Aggregatilinea sp. TaxID=2806333 RepID=UPI002CF4E6E6|nr:methyltransferase domain-containing protein [Aggregatilinea sp.]HML24124.1 methyltransferase domain-containing protein [Aggregatilinea sp.]